MKLKSRLLALIVTPLAAASAYAGHIETNGVTSTEPVIDPITAALLDIVQTLLAVV